MISEDHRCQRGGHFLVSIFNVVSAESLAELHHSGAWVAQADAASSSLFFLAAVLARSGQVLRWRLDPAFSSTTRIAQVDEREHFVAMTKGSALQRWTEHYHLCTARTFLLSWREWTRGPKRKCVTLTYYVDIRNVGEIEAVGCVLALSWNVILKAINRSAFARFMSERMSRNNTFVNSQRNFIQAIVYKT